MSKTDRYEGEREVGRGEEGRGTERWTAMSGESLSTFLTAVSVTHTLQGLRTHLTRSASFNSCKGLDASPAIVSLSTLSSTMEDAEDGATWRDADVPNVLQKGSA